MRTHNRKELRPTSTIFFEQYEPWKRTSAQSQANLSLLRSNSLKFQPQDMPWTSLFNYCSVWGYSMRHLHLAMTRPTCNWRQRNSVAHSFEKFPAGLAKENSALWSLFDTIFSKWDELLVSILVPHICDHSNYSVPSQCKFRPNIFPTSYTFRPLLSYAAEYLVVSWQQRKKTPLARPPVCIARAGRT